ncbi:hypothetical protein ONZ51_g11672 [Trametes cubensis]|uniref:Uncharacterized protein n=1 Tax=Trametes cubensis TaxID=1111947 RepID=A0AAD7TIU0_9APHY|nr:hypothetical protein ONZ51_g11672 [Trametes cubensis]
MTDTILFVKETQTCHYVIHIATPRLCGEPGFRSRIDAEEEHVIQCREVLGEDEYTAADRSLPAAPHPYRIARPQKKVIAPPPDQPTAKAEGTHGTQEDGADPHEELLRRAIQRLLARKGLGGADSHVVVEQLPDGEGELLIEFVDIDLGEGEDGEGAFYEDAEYADDVWLADGEPFDGRRLQDILRAAGFGSKGQKTQQQAPGNGRNGARGGQAGERDDSENEDAAEEGAAAKKPRDEL